MESPGFFEFRRNSTALRDVTFFDDDDGDSFFDLVINSKNNDFDFIASPMSSSTTKPNSNSNSVSPRKLKVFVLGLKKSSKSEPNSSPVSHFSRNESNNNSLRSQMLKESSPANSYGVVSAKSVPIYLKLIKPFYMKASKKAKVAACETPSSFSSSPVSFSPRKLNEGSRIGSFKIVARKLVKSRSTSAAVGIPPLPPPRRRDDTLLEQQDGIRSAILHCKKSYNSSTYGFSRSASDASSDMLRMRGRNSCEEQKRFSI